MYNKDIFEVDEDIKKILENLQEDSSKREIAVLAIAGQAGLCGAFLPKRFKDSCKLLTLLFTQMVDYYGVSLEEFSAEITHAFERSNPIILKV